ncbi:terpene synthase family protein [Streptomyces sp. NPDC048484]|uniref:terpene synthase family protein n=1 Tax=Streptomyces sp. NPDC048484 TaxID=3155146 RepID=UPI0034257798
MAEDPLAPYRAQLTDPRHETLAEQLLTWSLRHCSCHRGVSSHASGAFWAASFERHCAPADTAAWESLLGAKYIVFFWCQDDGSRSELVALADQLRSRHPIRAGELGIFYEALLSDMRAHGLETARVEAGIADTCAAEVAEPHQDIRTMTPEQFHTQRLATIATTPYIDCRRAARGLPAPDEEHRVEQAVEAVYIANDLASLDKEIAAGPTEPVTSNFVRFHAARTGQNLSTAITHATHRYNHLVTALRNAPPGPLTTILASIVDGSLQCQIGLSTTRYPGSAHRLSLLRLVSALV